MGLHSMEFYLTNNVTKPKNTTYRVISTFPKELPSTEEFELLLNSQMEEGYELFKIKKLGAKKEHFFIFKKI